MDEGKFREASSKYHMIGGNGPDNYAQNSDYQKELIVSAKDLIHDLTNKHLDINNPLFNPHNAFKIADFGCSIGPNTFYAVENIVTAIENKYKSNQNDQAQVPEFQVFFNDIFHNDFNTLFKNLPSTRQYFAAAVPGSFHTRLFPKSTLHFAHCATSLHWLSRIPQEVLEKSSNAWNKGRIHYSGAGKEVKEAYSGQFKQDMEGFLNARAEELVGGGLMVLVVFGFLDEALYFESSIRGAFDILASCLVDLVNMGKIDEEKLDSFNLPFYYTNPLEVKTLIEENGLFEIERIAKLASPMRDKPDAQVLTSHLRAVIGELIEEHFGKGIVDDLFKLHLKKLSVSPILVDEKYWKEISFLVFLKRKDK